MIEHDPAAPSDSVDEAGESGLVTLGHVSGVHGVRGWVKVWSATSPRGGIVEYSTWLVGDGNARREYKVLDGGERGGTVVARLEGIEDRDVARALMGQTISITREQMSPPESGVYYWVDLIGLDVFNLADEHLGKVSTLMETGAHDVLVVESADPASGQLLIPFVEGPYVKAVQPDRGRLVVDWEADF